MEVLNLVKPPSWIGAENIRFYAIKEVPTFESKLLNIRNMWKQTILFNLYLHLSAYWTPFRTSVFEHVWPRHDEGLSPEDRNSVVESNAGCRLFAPKCQLRRCKANLHLNWPSRVRASSIKNWLPIDQYITSTCEVLLSTLAMVHMNTCESRRNYLKHYKIYIPHQHTKFKCHFRMTKTMSNGKSWKLWPQC